MNRVIFVVAICLVTMAAVATAAAPEQRFEKLDTNRDGRLSREEAAAYPELAKQFAKIDANKDGFISLDELTAKRSGICG